MRKIPNPKRAAKLVTMAIGQVTKVNSAWNAARVSVPELHRDEYLNLYYERHQHFWAADPNMECTPGDIVRINLREKPQSNRIYHDVRELVFKVGQVVDPITGRRCRGEKFINEDLRKFGLKSEKENTVEQLDAAKSS